MWFGGSVMRFMPMSWPISYPLASYHPASDGARLKLIGQVHLEGAHAGCKSVALVFLSGQEGRGL